MTFLGMSMNKHINKWQIVVMVLGLTYIGWMVWHALNGTTPTGAG